MTESLTIVVSPGSTVLREHIAAWTAASLLRQSVWIDPAALTESVPDLVEMTVHHIAEKRVETTLRSVLGDAELDLVRVVLVRGPIDGDVPMDLDPCHADAADRTWEFAGRLRSVLAATTQLRRLNVIVPSGPEIDTRMLDVRSDVNIVVSPEDRPSDGAVDHGVARTEIYPAHAAFACATIGGLWPDMDTGAFDAVDQRFDEGTQQPGRTVVVRATARVVDVNGLPAHIIGRLLASGSRSLREYLPPSPNRTANNTALVKEAFEAFVPVERMTLWYRPPEPKAEPEPPRMAAMTWRMLMRILWQALRLRLRVLEWRQPSDETELEPGLKKWLYRVTARESGELPEYGSVTPDEMTNAAVQAPVNLKASAMLPAVTPVVPFLWRLVRTLCFGLIDGGPLPTDVTNRSNTLRPVVTDPRAIVAEPQQRFLLSKDEIKLLRHSKLGLSRLRVMDNSTMDRLSQVLSQAIAAEVPPGAGKGLNANQARRILGECLARLHEWRDKVRQDKSLMGQLLKHLQEQMTRAKDALLDQANEYRREEAERAHVFNRVEEVRRDIIRWAMIVLAPLGLAVTTAIAWVFTSPGLADRALGYTAIGAGVVLGAGLIVLWILAERVVMLDHQSDLIEARRRNTVALVEQWPTEAQRLSSLYSVMLDWAEIIGWLLHQPFRHDPGRGPQAERDEDLPRPETFHLVQPAGDLEELVREVAPRVFTEGWMTRLYDLVLDTAIPERTQPNHQPDARTDPDRAPGPLLKDTDETPEPETDPEPDTAAEPDDMDDPDDFEPKWYARDRLLRELRRDRAHRTVSGYLRSAVWQTLRDLPPERLTSLITVNPVDGNGVAHETSALAFMRRGLPPRTSEGVDATFAPAAFSDTGMMQGRPQVQRVNLWGITGPLGVVAADRTGEHGPEVIRAWPQRAEDTTGDAYQVALIRLDVSGDCDTEDLAHGQAAEPGVPVPDPIAD